MTHSRAVLRHRDASAAANGRNAGHFPLFLVIDLRDQTGWLGREDSNLRMAESKSDYSASNINTHFSGPTMVW